MKALLAPNSRGAALAYPKARATSSSRPYQRQMGADTERGQSLALGMCRLALAVVYAQDRPVLRAGIKAPTLHTCRGHIALGLSLCRSAAGNSSPPSRRSVLETLPGIGLHFPAERIRAARGGLYSVRVLGSTPSRAQSLADQHLHKLAVAKINHLTNALSSSLICCINKCTQARTNNCHSVTRGDG